MFITPESVRYLNILPYQMLSITALLIPFIENNDPNRALMASNMIKQSLPLIFPSKPIVSTGFENLVALNSYSLINCLNKSVLEYEDSRFIILKTIFNFKNFIIIIMMFIFIKIYFN
ncbi:hypothetical protein QUR95_00165 [Candidatus Nasuia deltocephalinicola]|nr:hypothetical protein QUR95_00165 [Candidatus Nasuia deltocephalinicola]